MTVYVSKLLKIAKRDEKFLHDVDAADGDKKPSCLASDFEEHVFVATYYGWYVGIYGAKCWQELKKKLKNEEDDEA